MDAATDEPLVHVVPYKEEELDASFLRSVRASYATGNPFNYELPTGCRSVIAKEYKKGIDIPATFMP